MGRLTMRRCARRLPRQRSRPSFRTTPSSPLLTLLAFRLTCVPQMCPVLRLLLLLLLLLPLASFQRQLLRRTTPKTQVQCLHRIRRTITAAPSRVVAPATSTPRRVLRKTTAQRTLTPVREDSPAGSTGRVGFEDVDPSLPAAQPLPSSEGSFSLGLSSVGESDIEMGTLREVKRGHTSSACSDEASDGRAETQRPKKPRPSSGRSKCAP
ncbi:hypothetical protein HPB50_028603 [Hyalomma asiaticum]|nr:hypothetical protein HPB50_028603 [Hyalomma asiaticum]